VAGWRHICCQTNIECLITEQLQDSRQDETEPLIARSREKYIRLMRPWARYVRLRCFCALLTWMWEM
jgi:hypothetical protein